MIAPSLRPPAAVRFDLMPGRPDVSRFPRAAWLAASRRALAAAPHDVFGYGDPRGRIELRRALADYLARVRGVRTHPERLLICSGYGQGLRLVGEALRDRGARAAAVEEYGLPQQQAVIAAAGLAMRPLPLDTGGAAVERLPDLDCAAAVLTPAHQYPTGVALKASRRAAAVEWARRAEGVVVEDDYDGEFRYDRQPVGAMQALDPERVVYAGTASKSLAPGLRLAWLALPSWLVEPVVRQKQLAGGQAAALDQLALAELITSGGYDRHIRSSRLHYRRRRDQLIATLAERAPEVRVTGMSAGLHAVLELPPGSLGEEELLRQAAWLGLGMTTLGRCRADAAGPAPDRPSALVIGYGTPPDHGYQGALDALCTLVNL